MYTNVSSSYLNWETGLALGSAQGKFAVRDKKPDAPLERTGPQSGNGSLPTISQTL